MLNKFLSTQLIELFCYLSYIILCIEINADTFATFKLSLDVMFFSVMYVVSDFQFSNLLPTTTHIDYKESTERHIYNDTQLL